MAVATPALSMRTYPLLFRQYVLRNVQMTLEQVRSSGDTLAAAVKEQAFHILDFALRLEESWPGLRELLLALLPYIGRWGERRRWIAYLERALALSQQRHDRVAEAQFAWSLGVLMRQLGELATAERHLQHCVALTAGLASPHLQAKALTELALLAQMQHQLAAAKTLVAQAHQQLAPDDRERAPGHSVLGDVFSEEQNWVRAAHEIEQAIALWTAQGQHVFAASGWRGLARVRYGEKDYPAAIHCYEQALALYDRAGEQIQRAIAGIGLAGFYVGQRQPHLALPWLATAEATLLPLHDQFHLAMLYLNYGIAQRMLGAWSDALHALTKSLTYYTTIGDALRQVNVLTEMSEVYLVMDDQRHLATTLAQAQSLFAQLPVTPRVLASQQAFNQLQQRAEARNQQNSLLL